MPNNDPTNSAYFTSILRDSAYILRDSGFSNSCFKGCLVAKSSETGTYIPALAQGSGDNRVDGTQIPSDSAIVVGLLLEDPGADGYADVMFYGCTADPDVIYSLLGDSEGNITSTGDYYLSDTTPGKAYRANYSDNRMSGYCFTYLQSTGGTPMVFFRPQLPPYNGVSEVRSVSTNIIGGTETKSPILSASNESGAVTVSLDVTPVSGESNGRAVISLDGGVITAPVVSGLTAGPGITVEPVEGDSGIFRVSGDTYTKSHLDMNLCVLSGAYLSTLSDNRIVYTMPTGSSSSITGVIRIPYLSNGNVTASVHVLLAGTGGSVSGLSVSSTRQSGQAATEYEEVNIKTVPTTQSTAAYVAEPEDNKIAVQSNDLLYLKLRSNGTSVARVLAVYITLS